MTLITRILTEQRVLVGAVAVALAADVALYMLAVYPWRIRVSNARERADAAEQRLKTVEDNHAAALATSTGKDRADQELRKFYTDILPKDLVGARRITYPRLAELAEQTNLRHERRSTVAEQDRDSHLGRLRTTMVLAGDYRNIRRFIHELEASPEFIVIDEVVLSQSEGTNAALVLTLGVSTYYRAGADQLH
jgi:hypothetical protein